MLKTNSAADDRKVSAAANTLHIGDNGEHLTSQICEIYIWLIQKKKKKNVLNKHPVW